MKTTEWYDTEQKTWNEGPSLPKGKKEGVGQTLCNTFLSQKG